MGWSSSSMESACVIREVAQDVWTFSCLFSRFGTVPVEGRLAAVKLSNCVCHELDASDD